MALFINTLADFPLHYMYANSAHLIAWAGIIIGGSSATLGWLWLLVAGRLGLTVQQGGWRGGVAVSLLIFGLFLIWHCVPMAFAN